jgi:thymidine phosphorylase
MDARAVGVAILDIGGGRTRPDQKIDHAVGLTGMAPVGTKVDKDRPLCVLHARDETGWERAAAAIGAAIRIGDAAPAATPAVRERLARMAAK